MVRWAKDPFRLGEQMRILKDEGGTHLNSDQEKVDGFIRNIFGREEGDGTYLWNREYPEWWLREGTLEELVLKEIRGTSNKLVAGPDGVGYRLIKLILGTRLGKCHGA